MGQPARHNNSGSEQSNVGLKSIAQKIQDMLVEKNFWDETFPENRASFSIKVRGPGNRYSDDANKAMNRISESTSLYIRNYLDSNKCSSKLRDSIAPLLFMVAVHDLDDDRLNEYRLSGVAIPQSLINARDSFLEAKYAYIENPAKKINREALAEKTKLLLDQLAEVKGAEPDIGGKHVDVLIKAYEFCKEVEKQVGAAGRRSGGGGKV
jgi:hypothetical protein